MKILITTLQGILLEKIQHKNQLGNGQIEYFVNKKPVIMWIYEKDGYEFYTEKISIIDFARQMNIKTGKLS